MKQIMPLAFSEQENLFLAAAATELTFKMVLEYRVGTSFDRKFEMLSNNSLLIQ